MGLVESFFLSNSTRAWHLRSSESQIASFGDRNCQSENVTKGRSRWRGFSRNCRGRKGMSPGRLEALAPSIQQLTIHARIHEGVKQAKEQLSARARSEAYNWLIMTSRSLKSPSMSEVCAHVKHLGYATAGRVRLYGEEFDVVSDPFPEADGIAVRVTTKKDSKVRVLQIPATVLQSARRQVPDAA
jgi:hypothetical protein